MKKRIISTLLTLLVVSSFIMGCVNSDSQSNSQAVAAVEDNSSNQGSPAEASVTPVSNIPEEKR